VRVRVEGNADLAVSEPFAGDLHVNAGCERVCRVVCRKSWEGVPQVPSINALAGKSKSLACADKPLRTSARYMCCEKPSASLLARPRR
jgi:hypothetical protein